MGSRKAVLASGANGRESGIGADLFRAAVIDDIDPPAIRSSDWVSFLNMTTEI